MDKLSKSLEVLRLLSTTKSETLIIKGNNENYFKLVKGSVETLFTTCDENAYNNFSWPIQQMCYPMVIARFLMTNAINQLLEYQNSSTRLIIVYLGLIKKILQLLGYSNLFDFDQLLISTQIGSIEEIRVSEALKTAYSTCQR
ncbi:unnamed protein product [Rotaria sp. Silwood1]|nr:unnamed protein product [Rotaria sp. Silwood1]CAF1655218.1 unnamed protein product [Rotaria sp. Silwood1]